MDRTLIARWVLTGTLVASFTSAAVAAGDPANGNKIFHQHCAVCHTTAKDASNGIGPDLFGVVGRTAGSLPHFNYSGAMKNSGITWDDSKLAAYIAHPMQVVPGNRMPFAGLSDPGQAADVTAYLDTLK